MVIVQSDITAGEPVAFSPVEASMSAAALPSQKTALSRPDENRYI
jgi:hypothetical protein